MIETIPPNNIMTMFGNVVNVNNIAGTTDRIDRNKYGAKSLIWSIYPYPIIFFVSCPHKAMAI